MTLMTLGTPWWVRLAVRVGLLKEESQASPRSDEPTELEARLRRVDCGLGLAFGKVSIHPVTGNYIRLADKRWLS